MSGPHERARLASGADKAVSKTDKPNDTAEALARKAFVETLAIWGVLPVKLAEWIIRRLHLGAA